MRILSIETSCDETALAIVEVDSTDQNRPRIEVVRNVLRSQIDLHKQYGGVFPTLAKREHARNLMPMLASICGDDTAVAVIDSAKLEVIREWMSHEPDLFESLTAAITSVGRPDIDMIAVTSGPGLEPALWVGINFARALSLLWNVPMLGVNHMEGHIASTLERSDTVVQFPAIALLISGGHTELVLVKGWGDYEVIGATRDDAVGEAFDKAARVMGLEYPGGPKVSARAREMREKIAVGAALTYSLKLPRPMIASKDLDFSFSGIKTAVLYAARDARKGLGLSDTDPLPDTFIDELCMEFEDACTEVLASKARAAVKMHSAKSLIVGGGVIANTRIRAALEALTQETTGVTIALPEPELATDNAIMIGIAGFLKSRRESPSIAPDISADGNLSL